MRVKFLFSIALFAISHFMQGQGCSDAGICTLNSFKPNSTTDQAEQAKEQLKIGAQVGAADHNISTLGGYLEYSRKLGAKLSADLKVTTLSQRGNGTQTFGLGDAFLNFNYPLSEKLKLTVGGKIPLSNGDARASELSMPMDFQASLGTFDLLLGLSYSFGNLQIVGGLQQPIVQNANTFLANVPTGHFVDYQSSNKFKRAGDLLLRVSYPIQIGQKLKITPSLLPILHLDNDQFTDEAGRAKYIDDSNGLTLNGNLYLDYSLGNRSALQLIVGAPFVVRKVRPDGLTRKFVAGLEYRFQF